MSVRVLHITALTVCLAFQAAAQEKPDGTLVRGKIVDADSGQLLPARIYIESEDGEWFFPRSASDNGSAVEYRKQRLEKSVEMHTTLSAHPFEVTLPPGRYRFTAERGKEYFTATKEVDVAGEPVEVVLPLKRWITMAERGWYSGDTHVHRSLDDLPNLVMAEDLNVALPLTYWVTRSDTPPTQGRRAVTQPLKAEVISVDSTHVVYPLNTEYELFTVKQKPNARHTLGAVFVLGHKKPFELGVPPVAPVAAEARRQGALLDLDKHSWPWSLMLVPVMNVDLFELSNNHVWRTEFAFGQWTFEDLPEYMNLETDSNGFTEWGWIDYGLQTYYALLNCGFRMRPTAGTASGVHPVPLGFGRVYVQTPGGFSYENWMQGLNAGRSFVTTGPMLFVEVNGQPPGSQLQAAESGRQRVTGSVISSSPIDRIEIIINGQVTEHLAGTAIETNGRFEQKLEKTVQLDGSGWIAVRVFERRPDKRIRFAHSSPVHIDVPDKLLRPRREEVRWIIQRMDREIARNKDVLTKDAVDEYRRARKAYSDIAAEAR